MICHNILVYHNINMMFYQKIAIKRSILLHFLNRKREKINRSRIWIILKGFITNVMQKQHLVFSLYQFSAKQIAHSFDTSAMRMEHSGIYKQDIHNDLRYFTPNIFLNFIPDKKRIHPSKADAPTLQSKNLPNTSALYCGRKNLLIHSLSDKRT